MTNAQVTSRFFKNVGKKVENEIITNIAKRYGVSNDDIYAEVYDAEAESLLDYVTVDRAAVALMLTTFAK
jgi:ribosomal protein S24E